MGIMVALLVVHGVLAAVLVVLVLVQRSERSALGGLGGELMSGVFAPRSAANFLTRATAIVATLFMGLALVLAYMSSHTSAPTSLFDDLPVTPTTLDITPTADPVTNNDTLTPPVVAPDTPAISPSTAPLPTTDDLAPPVVE